MEFGLVLMATNRTITAPASIRGERGQDYRVCFADGVPSDETGIRGVPGVSCARRYRSARGVAAFSQRSPSRMPVSASAVLAPAAETPSAHGSSWSCPF